MAELVISDLSGGMNNSDPPIALSDDQCVVAENVEFNRSDMGERRKGSVAVDLTGSSLATCDRIVWGYRHLPTSDPSDAQMWVMGIVGGTAVLAYKDSSWHDVTMADAPIVDGVSEYRINGQTIHGKLFIAYKSAVDRLHVWDGTSLRRVGLLQPTGTPSAGESGSGTITGRRRYRTREVVMSGSTVTLRSEPSEEVTIDPTGTADHIEITRPSQENSNSTHWELEAALSVSTDWYVIATTAIATTTASDSTAFTTGYATTYELSEDVGDYQVPGSARILQTDDDRLVMLGSFEDESLDSIFQWTPVYNATGVGNDERTTLDPTSNLNLDGFEGGAITDCGMWAPGELGVFKESHTYKVIRTGVLKRAYSAMRLSRSIGAIQGSVTEGVDEAGNAALYFYDHSVGLYRATVKGALQYAGADVRETWQTVNLDATVTARSLYYPTNRQIWSCIATDDADTPNLGLKLQTNAMRSTEGGDVRRGYSMVTGPQAGALTMFLFSDNVDDNTARSRTLVPFIGVEGQGLLWRCDTGDDDNGTAYLPHITTKPYAPTQLETQFEIRAGSLVAEAAEGATLTVSVVPNGGTSESDTSEPIDLTPDGDETFVIRALEFGISELQTVQFDITDDGTSAQWELARLAVTVTRGQGS